MPPQRAYGIPPGYRAGQNDSPQLPSPGPSRTSGPPRGKNSIDRMQGYSSAPPPPVSPVRWGAQRGDRTESPPHESNRRLVDRENAPQPRGNRSLSTSGQQDPTLPDRQRQKYTSTTFGLNNHGTASQRRDQPDIQTGAVDYQPFDSGSQALRDIDNMFGSGRMAMTPSPEPEEQAYYQRSYESRSGYGAYSQPPPRHSDSRAGPPRPPVHGASDSQSSIAPLNPRRAPRENESSSTLLQDRPTMPMAYGSYPNERYDEYVDHNDFDDDEDNMCQRPGPRRGQDNRGSAPIRAAVEPGTAGMFKSLRSRDASGSYQSVTGGSPGRSGVDSEKSEWLQKNRNGNKRMKWIVGSIIAVVLLAAIIGGAVGGILASKKSSSSSDASTSSSSKDGLYDINSSQVKKLLNNSALHKVFPGMDYTPLNAQYPDCLTDPPDQNNITLDMAMLAQLTPAVRLYGTDCNQTEMVLEAIDRLGYNDTLKVWLGVWLGNNATTNTRQLRQMYDILDTYPSTHFAGIIVGNEVLFRKDLTETELGEQLTYVRNNLTAKEIVLPVATSDLGDDWTTALAADTDIVMANVHPFFAGVTPDEAPGWTGNFWQTNDVALTTAKKSSSGYPKDIIAETGWPSEGGNDCGTESGTCPNSTAGAVASIDNMNTFMDGWVCQSLKNGTTYFWFEAFDEPWKVIYNTDTDKWESKWGLMDANRNVKAGLKIPDCGGQTVDKPY